jgi:hypothetical protein
MKLNDHGVSVVEFALLLPLLIVLVFGIIEFSRALFTNNAIINVSREGANLATRTSTQTPEILNAVARTARQVDMRNAAMIYLTRIIENDGVAQVTEQYRWTGSQMGSPPDSSVWRCNRPWDAGRCRIQNPLNPSRPANISLTLNPNEEIIAVEVFYRYEPIFNNFFGRTRLLYSATVL